MFLSAPAKIEGANFGAGPSCIFPRELVEYKHRKKAKGVSPVADEFGPDFITVTDEDAEGEEQEAEIVILKAVTENGEEFLSTPDTDEELDEVYELFMEQLFAEEDQDEE